MPHVIDDEEFRLLFDYFESMEHSYPTFRSFLNFTIDSPDFDHARLTIQMRNDLVGNQIYRTLHGGIIASILDNVAGHAVFLAIFKQVKGLPMEKQIKRASKIGSIDLRIDYLRPGKGNVFTATATILRTGNKVAVTRMELHNETQELIAVGTGTYTVG